MAQRALCIHGHFYQPPREDPLSGEIPNETGASPFANWNEKIHETCYRPNAELGNYERISFDFGPTLTSWMEQEKQPILNQIVQQDRENVARYGVGNAMAHPYHHIILPLANRRDKVTQVKWGMADFERLYGRKPEGMWLPETAVDRESLEVLAENGIRFTILAPWQAAQDGVDIRKPYRVRLPENREMIVFFYHQAISTGVSFNPHTTENADAFIHYQVMPNFSAPVEDELILVASDGELYGHHQSSRELFLAYLTQSAAANAGVEVTFPARWLKDHPVREWIEIRDHTSWSCFHNLDRWRRSCGCTPLAEWKAPLRQALVDLAADMDDLYAQTAGEWVRDVWELRDRYIQVLQRRQSAEALIGSLAKRTVPAEALNRLHMLLQSQFERQRMFTSCGWFFADFDRVEPKYNIAYTAWACWLIRQATGVDLSYKAANLFQQVQSRAPGLSASGVFYYHWHRIEEKEERGELEAVYSLSAD